MRKRLVVFVAVLTLLSFMLCLSQDIFAENLPKKSWGSVKIKYLEPK